MTDRVEPLRQGDPDHLGAYRILGRLGDGGQGVVFLAEAPGGDRVAVKLLHRDLAGDPEARTRFLREAAAAKRVARFCTAQVLDADAAGDRPYIVGEYVPGPSLQRLVETEGPRGGAALERLAISTATALAGIHKAGVVHRDFKPQNVLIGPDGPRVIDFGVARALDASSTATSGVVGTPSYMAPEQLAGGRTGPPADVVPWAVTMVYAATGRPAFGSDTIPAVMHRILHERPELPPLPRPLGDLIEACLAKDPAARPTAQHVLLTLLGEEQPAAAPYGPDGPPPPAPAGAHASGPSPVPAGERDPDPAGGTRTLAGRPGRRRWVLPVAAAALVAIAGTAAAFSYGNDGRPAATGPRVSPAPASRTPARSPAVKKTRRPTPTPARGRRTTPPAPAPGRACGPARPVGQGRARGQYCTVWGSGIPVHARPDAASPVVGRLVRGGAANWFVGQATGGRYQRGRWWNTHWAYTLSDGSPGAWGWVPIVYFQGGANGAPDATLAPCGARCHPY